MNQTFVNDIKMGTYIQTDSGLSRVTQIENSKIKEYMFDVTVDSNNHRFYTNGILSHNSTAAAGYLLWYAMFVPDSNILIAAHQYSGAQEIMTRIRYAYELCPDHIRAGVTTYNKGNIDFENGSRILSAATTENTGRGLSISLLYCDEFAFVRPTIAKEFWTSISPTLATGGKAIITSTPNSDEDQFATIWKGANKCEDEYGNVTELGKNGFKAYRSYWHEHPDRDEAWAAEQMAQLGEERFRREMGCEFLIFEETLIAATTLIDLEPEDPIHKTGQVRWFRPIEKDKIYLVALDPSLGTGGDPAAIQIFEAKSATQVGEWRHNKTTIPEQIAILADICKHINNTVQNKQNIYYSVENNTIGEAALISISQYGENNIEGYFLSESKQTSRTIRKGFTTTKVTKQTACSKLKTMMEGKKMKVYSSGLISEMKTFIATGITYAAKIGETDDLVMATLLAVRMMQELQSHYPDLDKHMRDFDKEIVQPLPFFSTTGQMSLY